MIDFCSKDELLKFMRDEAGRVSQEAWDALGKSLKEADEGKLISFEEVKTKTEGTLKMPRGYMKKLMGKMKVLDVRGKGFHKRNRRANRKVARETTATCRNVLPDGKIPMDTICQETSRRVNRGVEYVSDEGELRPMMELFNDPPHLTKRQQRWVDRQSKKMVRDRRETTATRLWQIFVRRVKNG